MIRPQFNQNENVQLTRFSVPESDNVDRRTFQVQNGNVNLTSFQVDQDSQRNRLVPQFPGASQVDRVSPSFLQADLNMRVVPNFQTEYQTQFLTVQFPENENVQRNGF